MTILSILKLPSFIHHKFLLGRFKPDNPNRQIQLTYQTGCICSYLDIQYPILFALLHLKTAAIGAVIVGIFFVGSIILNYKKYYSSAKFLLFFSVLFCLIYYSILLGQNAGAHLILFGLTVFPILIFNADKIKTVTTLSLLPLLTFVLLELLNKNTIEPIPQEISKITYLFGGTTSFMFILFQIFNYSKISQNSLMSLTTKLSAALSTSETQKKLLEEANKTLREKEILDKEMKIATQLQNALMPEQSPQYTNFDIQFYYKACREIGGDYYDFLPKSSHILFGVVADMTGKGIPASIMMMHFRNLVHKSITPHTQIAQLMHSLNNTIIHNKFIQKSVSCAIWKLDTKTNKFTISVAGMEPMILVREGDITSIDQTSGCSLGMFEDSEYDEYILNLKKGDKLLLFSDGICDQRNNDKEAFGYERVEKNLKMVSHLPGTKLMAHILQELETFSENTPQTDDMTMIVIEHV